MTGDLILNPLIQQLKKEIEELKTNLSVQILELDNIRLVENKNIEMEYMMALGGLEYKLYEHQCLYLRLKRKAEMIQALKNRQKPVDIAEIEKQLDEEFSVYQERLKEQTEKMNEALDRRYYGITLSPEDTKELKRLYRLIVKALHPDLHPDLSPEMNRLFRNAIDAYQNGDLAAIRAISDMLSNSVLPEREEDALEALLKEKERLQTSLENINKRIKEIKNEYPYNMQKLLSDEKLLQAKRDELQGKIDQFKRLIGVYRTKIEEMLR
ncbi:hypothetical protein IJT93_04310 [bacterium]|nr:hypothetical protein [bacterium]